MKYQVGGSLPTDDPSYIIRQADKQLYSNLKDGDFCYVFNSRQMGKSSLLHRTKDHLMKADNICTYIDITRLGSEDTTAEQWYKGIIICLFYDLNLSENVNFPDWWKTQTGLSSVQKLHNFVEEILLTYIPEKRIFIFIDEIDSLLSLNFPISDFFAWIRHCYNQRAHDPKFQRLGFAVFGVASPSDLITDKQRTPFNVGKPIPLYGFTLEEATPLVKGLEGVVSQPQAVLQKIIKWTGGQPFLTQKICQLVVQTSWETPNKKIDLPPGTEEYWIEQLLQKQIINHWEAKDEPEHLRTIRDRLLFNEQRAGKLLGIYQKVLQAEIENNSIAIDDSQEQKELFLSGLVEKCNGYLKIRNPIYRHVFNDEWVERQLNNLRPYSQIFHAWVASNYQDESRLLRGKALQDAQIWLQGKSLSDLDYKFFAASQEYEQREIQTALKAERSKEIEARLAQEKKTAKLQRWLLIVMCIKLLISITLGCGIYILYRQSQRSEYEAKTSEIQALVSASEGMFASNRRLDALIKAITAKQRLNKLEKPNSQIEDQVKDVLQQAVYGADEYNRFAGHSAAVMAVDVSPDSSLIASASIDKIIKIWRRDGTAVATLTGHEGAIRSVKFSPDGKILASASEDRTIKLWQQQGTDKQWQISKTLKGHTASVWGVAFSPDGKMVATASADGTAKTWTLEGKLLTTLVGHSASVWRVAFSPDGKMVATGSGDNTVKLWTVQGKLLQTFKGHTGAVWGVGFSPDGKMIASGSVDATVRLWKLDGTEITTLRGHTATIRNIAVGRDGTFLASGGDDNTLIIWNLPEILKLNTLVDGCHLVKDYLKNNSTLDKSDRHICDQN